MNNKYLPEKLLKQISKYKYVLIVIACGVLLMNIDFSPQNISTQQDIQNTDSVETDNFDLSEFEQDIKQTLEKIDGVGRIEIILSLKSSTEAIYAEDIRTSSGGTTLSGNSANNFESAYTIISGDTGQTPILIKSIYPVFKGAVIVCDGADNSKVQLEITEAISALCDLSSDKISILKMKS